MQELLMWISLAIMFAIAVEKIMSVGIKFFIWHILPVIFRPLVFLACFVLSVYCMKQTRDIVMKYQSTPIVDLFKTYIQNYTDGFFNRTH